MSKLSDFSLLAFDVYGTLVDWETGILTALEPLLESSSSSSSPPPPTKHSKEHILKTYQELEGAQQRDTPELKYSDLLSVIHPRLASNLGLRDPSPAESKLFGESIGSWPAFEDTVEALGRLGQRFKLVVLSNVDRDSFSATNGGTLKGVPFDAVYTAQDIGSYKPDARNFDHLLQNVKKEFGIERHQILQTAQSQFHDHRPAQDAGIKSVWIQRQGGIMGNVPDHPIFDWKFNTLGEMADALEQETK